MATLIHGFRLNYWQSPSQIKKQIEYNSSRRLQKFYREASGDVCGYKPQFDDKYPSVDQNLIRIIRKYPRVQFFILFAPQTRQSLVVQKFEFLNRYFGSQYYLVQKSKSLYNVKLFGFENDDLIVNNIANYRDTHHYHSGVNKFMLDAVRQNKNIMTIYNIDLYIRDIVEKLCEYRPNSNFETMLPFALFEENITMLKKNLRGKQKNRNK